MNGAPANRRIGRLAFPRLRERERERERPPTNSLRMQRGSDSLRNVLRIRREGHGHIKSRPNGGNVDGGAFLLSIFILRTHVREPC